jgi:hypothetical protein
LVLVLIFNAALVVASGKDDFNSPQNGHEYNLFEGPGLEEKVYSYGYPPLSSTTTPSPSTTGKKLISWYP